jgi:LPXTG-site transpeptidase (sortase) family protein
VDNSGPAVGIGAPSVATTNTGPVDFPITVTGANTINLVAGNVTLNTTGTATGTVSVTNGNTVNPTVTISGITGDGTIGISIAAGVASDGVGNTSPAVGPSATFTVDNTGPLVTIDEAGAQPDPTNTGPINFTVVFSEATTNFATGDITLSGTAVGGPTTATVTGGPTIYNVAVNGMIGDGTVIATVAASVATDALGNLNTASSSLDNTVTYDTSGPIVTIGAPSVAITTTGPVDFPITITGATAINLTVADITLNTTGTATGTITVTNGTTANPTVTISATTGSGTIGISIAAGVASDGLGNTSAAAGPSATFIVDNGGPVVTASVPANSSSVTGPTQLTVTFNEDVSAVTGNNIANYLLLNDSGDSFDDAPTLTTCLTGSNPNGGNDLTIPINTAVYANGGGSGPFITTLGINGGVPLPVGVYRLYVCGTTSIEDLVGNELNNGLNDTIIAFTVIAAPTGGGGNTRAAIPTTGFAMGEVTSLPIQPADKAYVATDMWIEIPKLNVKMSIVGVPQTKSSWDVKWIGRDAGWLNGSAFPTWSGNSVLTGHVWDAAGKPGPFALLKDLKYGDQVKIHAFGQVFTYEIRESSLISPTNVTTMMQHEEKSWITLITCEVFNEKTETYSYRRMVKAVLISVTAEK